jgi:hypothetical protein
MTDDNAAAAPRRLTGSAILLSLALGITILVACLALFASNLYSGLYIYTPVQYAWNCSATLHCNVTLRSEGGGFDHGFNPAVHWSISGQPEESLLASPGTGTLQAGQITTILVSVVPGSCPTSVSITSKNSTFIISPFTIGPEAHQCVLSPGSSGSG